MKYVLNEKLLNYFFVSTLLIQCKHKEKETSKIQFYINNFDFNYNQMEVTFELINNSNEIWEEGKWELHWNQFSGNLDKKSLPDGIKIIPTKMSITTGLVLDLHIQLALEKNLVFRQFKME